MNRNIPGNKPFYTEEIHVSTEETLLNNLAQECFERGGRKKRGKLQLPSFASV